MIKVKCSNCGKHLEAPYEAAGKKGKCPECKTVFEVPSASTGGRTCPGCGISYPACTVICTPCGINLDTGEKVPVLIRIYCALCKKHFEVSDASDGKKVKCPGCDNYSTILPCCPECGSGNVECVASNEYLLACLGLAVMSRLMIYARSAYASDVSTDLLTALFSIAYLVSLALLPFAFMFAFIQWIIRKFKQGREYFCNSCDTKYYVKEEIF